ncbi:MAG: 16S rRNA (uracil(1498)-N(3))-methyltransferase [Bacteroidetes bacterium]|nr:16S rRNA (uracil(1498)-N(3))-methyltransferase [Bacteroidota bacterium]
MIIFHTTEIEGNIARLSGEEARHCLQVLRRKAGDTITLVDGKGTWYEGVISQTEKRSCSIELDPSKTRVESQSCHLHMAVAPTKNISRYEWFLEKATEMGIGSITPILCRHSERNRIRPDRLEKILLSAMKQSMKAHLPVLNPMVPFGELDFSGKGYIAHCENTPKTHLWNNYTAGTDVSILIGPEGDFHPDEIALAIEKGFDPVHLGQQRLRTETAALAAVHTIQLANEIT